MSAWWLALCTVVCITGNAQRANCVGCTSNEVLVDAPVTESVVAIERASNSYVKDISSRVASLSRFSQPLCALNSSLGLCSRPSRLQHALDANTQFATRLVTALSDLEALRSSRWLVDDGAADEQGLSSILFAPLVVKKSSLCASCRKGSEYSSFGELLLHVAKDYSPSLESHSRSAIQEVVLSSLRNFSNTFAAPQFSILMPGVGAGGLLSAVRRAFAGRASRIVGTECSTLFLAFLQYYYDAALLDATRGISGPAQQSFRLFPNAALVTDVLHGNEEDLLYAVDVSVGREKETPQQQPDVSIVDVDVFTGADSLVSAADVLITEFVLDAVTSQPDFEKLLQRVDQSHWSGAWRMAVSMALCTVCVSTCGSPVISSAGPKRRM